MTGLIKALILWVICSSISYMIYKKCMTKAELLEEGIADECTIANNADIETMFQHLKISFSINCVALILATFIPLQFLRWGAAIACAFTLPPVFYDAIYITLPKMKESRTRFAMTIASFLNLFLIIYDLNYLYWTYLHKVFI